MINILQYNKKGELAIYHNSRYMNEENFRDVLYDMLEFDKNITGENGMFKDQFGYEHENFLDYCIETSCMRYHEVGDIARYTLRQITNYWESTLEGMSINTLVLKRGEGAFVSIALIKEELVDYDADVDI